MRNAISKSFAIVILIGVIIFGLQFINSFIKKSHSIDYTVKVDEKDYLVKEIYSKSQDNSYTLEIKVDDSLFIYSIKNTFNKQERILKNLIIEKVDNQVCIYPIFLKNTTSNIMCSVDGNNISQFSSSNLQAFAGIKANIIAKGYNVPDMISNNEETVISPSLKVYYGNFLKNDILAIWEYKGLEVFNGKKSKYISILSGDKYQNTHGQVVGKYYVIPQYEYGKVFDFNKLNVIDLTDYSKETIQLDRTVKQDTFINGVVDNKLFYFDPDSLTQFEINPSKKSYKILGTPGDKARYYSNGSWDTINAYDIKNTLKHFKNDYSSNEKLMNYKADEIIETSLYYYLVYSNGNVYKLNKNNLDKPILLFYSKGMVEIKVIDDTVYFISGDSLYYYNDDSGIKIMAKYNEFMYNPTNLYGIYKES